MVNQAMKKKPARSASALGGTLIGFVVGLLVGLGVALAVAVYVTRVPIPRRLPDDPMNPSFNQWPRGDSFRSIDAGAFWAMNARSRSPSLS